jgi:dihydrofolate reductase
MCKKNRGIGFQGKLPWKNSTDMKFFQRITTNCLNDNKMNAVIMGRNTFEGMNKILPNRYNVCITSKKINIDNLHCFTTLDEALKFLYAREFIESIFVIGGETLYITALEHPGCYEIILNEIDNDVVCDTFFPSINENVYNLESSSTMNDNVTNLHYMRKL